VFVHWEDTMNSLADQSPGDGSPAVHGQGRYAATHAIPQLHPSSSHLERATAEGPRVAGGFKSWTRITTPAGPPR